MNAQCLVYLIQLLIYAFTVHSDSWYGSHFLCHGRNKCYDDQIHCDANTPCVVHCHGANSCQYAVIHCPTNATCDVSCGGGLDACKDVVFLAKRSTSLSIACDRSQEEAFDHTLIYCPDNGPGGPIACHISGVSEVNVQTKMEIFAVEGLNDVEISGTYVTVASLYCKADYSSPCTLMNASPFNECASSDKTCERYLIPTPLPTPEPTSSTAIPTRAPTATTPAPTASTATTSTNDADTQTPTGSPTASTDTPTPAPTLTPTGRPRNLEYTPRPTRQNTRYDTPTKSPTLRPTRSTVAARPTRKTQWGLFDTTTTPSGDHALNIVDDTDTDTDTSEDIDYEEETQIFSFKPLYYVVGALLVSICYVSVSLFCWVHYNQKYTNKVMELKNRNAVQPPMERREPRVPIIPARSNIMSTSNRQCEVGHKNPYQLHANRNHRPRFMTGSTIAASDAPTSANSAHSNAPTSSRGSGSTCSCSNCSSDDELKEVDYETGGGMLMEQDEEYSDVQSVKVETPVMIEAENEENEDEEFKEVDYETTTAGEPTKKEYSNNPMFSSSISSSRPIPHSVYSMGMQMPSVSASHVYGYNSFTTPQQWPPPPPPGQ